MNTLIEFIDNDEICLSKNVKIDFNQTHGLIQELILKSLNYPKIFLKMN